MMKAIEADNVANREADIAAQKLKKAKIDKSGSGVCRPRKVATPMASSYYYHIKPITGANAHLEATINNSGGYWKFGTIENV